MNNKLHPLQKHEIEELRQDENLKDRLIRSYELMLDFFGMKLVGRESGEIARSNKNRKQQYSLLNSSFHNYLRITRILKCLGEFGLENYQAPFCEFVLYEIFDNGQLTNTLKSCLSYWGKVIKDFDTRKIFYEIADSFVQADIAKNSGIVRRELNNLWSKLKQGYTSMLPLWRRVKVAANMSTPHLASPPDTSSTPHGDVIRFEPKLETTLPEEKEFVPETDEIMAQETEYTDLSSQNGATRGNDTEKMKNGKKQKTDPNSGLSQGNERKKMCETETAEPSVPPFICLMANNSINSLIEQ